MRVLAKTFTRKHITYRQIKREGNVAVYSYSPPDEPTRVRGYETIVITPHEQIKMFGNIVKAHKTYPGDNAFGKKAWSHLKLENALDKMAQVVQDEAMKVEKKTLKASNPPTP